MSDHTNPITLPNTGNETAVADPQTKQHNQAPKQTQASKQTQPSKQTQTSQSNQLTAKHTEWFKDTFETLVENAAQVLLGKNHAIALAYTAMLAEGHLLLEDVPGTGKTSLARAMADSVAGTNSRIQFTPDLLPADVTGVSIYDQKTGDFEFHQGPIFANIVLADEINRASPKTQSALLEVMEEQQVTVDGHSHKIPVPFLVVATQNPVEQAGTYRLPEAQLDRFMLKTSLGYPDHASTIKILQGTGQTKVTLQAVTDTVKVQAMAQMAKQVYLDPLVADYIAQLVEATRLAPQVRLGASVRAAIALTKAAKTWALAAGRNYVTPDDVKTLVGPVLTHRIVLDPEAEFDGLTADAIIAQILLDITPPLGNR